MDSKSVFDILNAVNVNGHTEKKNGLTYLSWAWAWAEIKKAFPLANYTIYERETAFGPVNYFTDGRTCWVKTGLTINDLEHIEELPVMDFRNNSIPLDKVTSMDVNKAIQRSLTKAAARHGLGLYIYAGEDLPEAAEDEAPPPPKPEKKPAKKPEGLTPVSYDLAGIGNTPVQQDEPVFRCDKCGKVLKPYTGKNGKQVSLREHAELSRKNFAGKLWCLDCIADYKAGVVR